MPKLQTDPALLPDPSAELVLFRVHVEAMVTVLGRKKAERYIRLMAETLAKEESLSEVFQLRPAAKHAEVRTARKQAAAIFQGYLPSWVAKLADD